MKDKYRLGKSYKSQKSPANGNSGSSKKNSIMATQRTSSNTPRPRILWVRPGRKKIFVDASFFDE